MALNASQLFEIYHATKNLVSNTDNQIINKKFQFVSELFSEKQNDFTLQIMVYGVYNAGKSTLINALLGEKCAATGDVPLTDKIFEYQWNNYVIYDTPGVDAPKDHEIVTVEQLRKVDGIIFVVNPSGAAEEEKTLKVLVDLLADKKKVFLVFNEKNSLSNEDFVRLKDLTRERIQVIAENQGLHDILKEIPIFKVNALRALKGKLDNKPGLLNLSGFPELTAGLDQFLSSITNEDICVRLTKVLSDFITDALFEIKNNSQSTIIEGYNDLLVFISTCHQETRGRLKALIEREKTKVYRQSKQLLFQDLKNSESIINKVFEEGLESIGYEYQQEAQHLEILLQDKIDNLQKIIITNDGNQGLCSSINMGEEESTEIHNSQDKESTLINADNITSVVKTVQTFTKPDHIVTGLKVVKDWMPSLMKGIGPKTMEKWASAAVGKWIPYVGTAVTVLTSVWSMFSADSEDQQLQRQITQQKKERERFEQQVNDYAEEISSSFENSANNMVFESLDPWICELIEKIKETLGEMNEHDRNNQNELLSFEHLQIKLNG